MEGRVRPLFQLSAQPFKPLSFSVHLLRCSVYDMAPYFVNRFNRIGQILRTELVTQELVLCLMF